MNLDLYPMNEEPGSVTAWVWLLCCCLLVPKALKEALLDFKVKADPIRTQIKKSSTTDKNKDKPKPKGAAKRAAKK